MLLLLLLLLHLVSPQLVAPDGSRDEVSVGPEGSFLFRALRPGIEYEVGISVLKGIENKTIEPERRRFVMQAQNQTGKA